MSRKPLDPRDLAAQMRRPGLYVLQISHDAGCPTLTTGRGDDCACDPDVAVVPLSAARGRPERGGRRGGGRW